jgi:hypothetical protein
VKGKCIANLLQSGLGEGHWYSSLSHSAQTYNATPHSANPDGASPRNMWHGRMTEKDGKLVLEDHNRIDESFRRAFGATAYVRLDDRTIFGKRSQRGVFLGYPPDHADGTYEILNLDTNKVMVSRDVYFDERNVTDVSGHGWLTAEGQRTLPAWADHDPFTVADPVMGKVE